MKFSRTLKGLADNTRLSIIKLLLRRKYCVRALAKQLRLSDAAISQQLKILKEAGLLIGRKQGYFMHYEVDRDSLRNLAKEIESILDNPTMPASANDCRNESATCHCKSGSAKHGGCHSKNKGEHDEHCECG